MRQKDIHNRIHTCYSRVKKSGLFTYQISKFRNGAKIFVCLFVLLSCEHSSRYIKHGNILRSEKDHYESEQNIANGSVCLLVYLLVCLPTCLFVCCLWILSFVWFGFGFVCFFMFLFLSLFVCLLAWLDSTHSNYLLLVSSLIGKRRNLYGNVATWLVSYWCLTPSQLVHR